MTGSATSSKHARTEPRDPTRAKVSRVMPVVEGNARLLGGTVVRIFLPAYPAMSPYVTAQLVKKAQKAVERSGESPSLIVLPSGAGRIRTNAFCLGETGAPDRAEVEEAVVSWVESFRKHAGENLPPVVLGADGDTENDTAIHEAAIQLGVSIPTEGSPTITWKSLPTQGERSTLVTLWGNRKDTPPEDALRDNHPIASLGGRRALVLVCHDATAFAGRAQKAANEGSWSGTMQSQYSDLVNGAGFSLVVHVIHRLPRKPRRDRMTSPVFQNAHRELGAKEIPVVAVAGLNSSCPTRAFNTLHTRLACAFRHVDVMARVR